MRGKYEGVGGGPGGLLCNFKEDAERFVGGLLELFELGVQRGKQLGVRRSRELRIFHLMDQLFRFIASRQQFRRARRRVLQGKSFISHIDMLLQ